MSHKFLSGITIPQNGAIGKVLTSDGSGVGSWASLSEPWTDLQTYHGTIAAAGAAGTYLMSSTGGAIPLTSAAIAGGTGFIHLDPTTNYAVSGYTPRVRVVATMTNFGAAQTGNFTFGLYPITAISTAGIATVGTVIASSTAAINTPANGSINTTYSAAINMPATGHYCVCLVTSAVIAASSTIGLHAFLQGNVL